MPTVANFGWLPPDERTTTQKRIHNQLILAMPAFRIVGSGNFKVTEKGPLWECVKKIRGKHLPPLYQQVGSCVGHGKCNAEWYLMHAEKILKGEREKPILPYEPYGYAQSRVCAGIRGNEDGSTGSGAAAAAKRYGVLDSTLPGLPAFQQGEKQIVFSGNVDKQWGNRGAPSEWITAGSKHLVKTTALIRNTDEVVEALSQGYPITIASNWGGMMTPPVTGNPGVRLNRRSTTWNHQMMVSNFWDHPTLGMLFWIQNSWGVTHGSGPDDCPEGGFWVKPNELAYIIAQQETFVYSQFDGFPETDLSREIFKIL